MLQYIARYETVEYTVEGKLTLLVAAPPAHALRDRGSAWLRSCLVNDGDADNAAPVVDRQLQQTYAELAGCAISLLWVCKLQWKLHSNVARCCVKTRLRIPG
jgi:hypothetical protein